MSKRKDKKSYRGAFNQESFFTDGQHENAMNSLREVLSQLKSLIPVDEIEESRFYFIFENHIIYFRDLRIKDWQFAVWANYDEKRNYINCSFIGEHDKLIDKFKPSRTWVSTKDMKEFIEILNTIIKYPAECYQASKYFCKNIQELKEKKLDLSPKEELQKDIEYDKNQEEMELEVKKAVYEIYPKLLLERLPYLSGVAIHDNDTEYSTCYPKFDLYFSVSQPEIKKRGILYVSLREEVDKCLDEINQQEMKKYKDCEYSNVHRYIIDYSSLPRVRVLKKVYEKILTSYTELFRYGNFTLRERNNINTRSRKRNLVKAKKIFTFTK